MRYVAFLFVLLLAFPAAAQPPSGGRRGASGSRTETPAPSGGAAPAPSGGRTEATPPTPDAETTVDEETDDEAGVSDATVRETTEGGQRVNVFRFSGLDISGRLRMPQLLYFLNRMRAEFDRPRLPHRSFFPELGRTTKEDSF